MTTTLPILFDDAEGLIVNKPSGLSVEKPRKGGESLADHLEDLRLGFQRLPVAVHRLDQDTSGCLLLGRNPTAVRRFSMALEERRVEKRYLGIVAGHLLKTEGTVEMALKKISSAKSGWRMIAARVGKEATTHWRKIAVVGDLTLVEFRPETGRTHQIRVHAASGLGVPLLGDPVYGPTSSDFARYEGRAARTMLHSAFISVPRLGREPVAAHAPFPEDFAALGFEDPAG